MRKHINTEDKLKRDKLITYMIAIFAVALVVNIIAIIFLIGNRSEAKNTDILAVNDIISEPIESTDIENDTDGLSEDRQAETAEETHEQSGDTNDTSGVAPAELTQSQESADPYSILAKDIQALKDGDTATIARYFGDSTAFTSKSISDKLTATVVTFVSSEQTETGTKLIVHICTLDYNKLKTQSDTLTAEKASELSEDDKIELAKGVVQGLYDLHYNIPVEIQNGQVVVTEELKQAITGNWYTGVDVSLTTVDCPISK